jgi:hypothetical protein
MGVVSSSHDLPLERGGVEGAPSTTFFLCSNLPAPLGPMVRANLPRSAGGFLQASPGEVESASGLLTLMRMGNLEEGPPP